MRAQTEEAIEEADLTLFRRRCQIRPDAARQDLWRIAASKRQARVLVANKSEAKGSEGGFYDAFTLVSGEPCPISAEHGQGMIDLHNAIVEAIARAAPILRTRMCANRCQHSARSTAMTSKR